MKILWCFLLYLAFNNFQTIASYLQNENEETNAIKDLMQRMEALEKLFDRSNKLLEENKASEASRFEQIQQRLETLEKLHEKKVERVDCGKRCANDESCVSMFWSNSSDSECRFNQDNSTLVKFVPGELYYCKDECASCLAESNTVCDESRIPPVCSCAGNHLPVDGNARNGCKDPCNGLKDRNNVCIAITFEQRSCECKEGHFEIFREDPCYGCLICPTSLGCIIYPDFSCLKEHRTHKKWEDACSTCISEEGDLFSPGDKQLILTKDEISLKAEYGYDADRQWLMIDLADFFLITKIRVLGRSGPIFPKRLGNFKVYLSSSFDENADFTEYQKILDVTRNAASENEIYSVDRIRSGRFVIFYKTIVGIFEANEIEVMGLVAI